LREEVLWENISNGWEINRMIEGPCSISMNGSGGELLAELVCFSAECDMLGHAVACRGFVVTQPFVGTVNGFRRNRDGGLALAIFDCEQWANLSGSWHGGAVRLKIKVKEVIRAFTQFEKAAG
jgi:hypothetical protein